MYRRCKNKHLPPNGQILLSVFCIRRQHDNVACVVRRCRPYYIYDNADNQDNHPSCFRHLGCRKKIAHSANNVSLAAKNVNSLCPSNRSSKAARGTETQCRRHCLGDRFSCKRYRKSCNAYRHAPIATPPRRPKRRFPTKTRRFFRGFNQSRPTTTVRAK